jgi:hypothetical protein
MRKIRYVLALLLLMALAPLGSSGSAGASGGPEGRIEARESEPPDTFGPLLTDTAVPAAKGTLYVQPFWSLGSVTGVFNTHGKQVSAGGNFRSFEYDLQITYGAWDNFEVFTFIPVKVNWANSLAEPGSSGERSAWYAGLGDLNLTLKYRLVKEGPVAPTITAVCATNFPTGRYKNVNPILQGTDALGSGSYVPTTGVNLSKWVKPFIFYANLYYSMPTSFTNNEGKQHPRDFVTANLAAEYPVTEKWVALLEFTSFWDGARLYGPSSNVAPAHLLSVLPGIEFLASEKLGFYLGVNLDLMGRNTIAQVTPIFSLVWQVH